MAQQTDVKKIKYDNTPVEVDFADKALQAKADSNGDIIVDTYAKKTAVTTELAKKEDKDNLGDLAYKNSIASTELTDTSNLLRKNDVVDNVVTASTNTPLSANQGKVLQDEIDNLKAIGRYLSGWNSATGLPTSEPSAKPYTYKTGDYFIVQTVSQAIGENYKPNGSSYTGDASTTIESQEVKPNDYYRYDGTSWNLEINTQRTTTWGSIGGNLDNQTDLKTTLDNKSKVTGTVNSDNKWNSLTIDGVTHSLADTEYTQGTGVNIVNKQISIDSSVVALKTDLKITTTDTSIDW